LLLYFKDYIICSMRQHEPEFLGQDLMRSAFEAGSLEPFEAPAGLIADDAVDIDRRAGAFKALTFGLSGIAITGWQRSITEGGTLAYEHRFTENLAIVKDIVTGDFGQPMFRPSEGKRADGRPMTELLGERTLRNLSQGLTKSAQRYTGMPPGFNYVEGIDVHDVVETLAQNARIAHEQGVSQLPTSFLKQLYVRGFTPQLSVFTPSTFNPDHLYSHADAAGAIAGGAANFVRFTAPVISGIMRHFADRNISRIRPATELKVTAPEDCGPEHIPEMLSYLLKDTVRASQRLDGAETRIDDQRRQCLTLERNAAGTWFPNWERRTQNPPTALQPSDQPPTSGRSFQPVRSRQKCPIGYTPEVERSPDSDKDAVKTPLMPGQILAEATLQFMRDNLLDLPAVYMLEV